MDSEPGLLGDKCLTDYLTNLLTKLLTVYLIRFCHILVKLDL